MSVYKCVYPVMPDLIRHPEGIENSGFLPEFIPAKAGAGMTTFSENSSLYKDSKYKVVDNR
jgi:hypothetical protein